MNHDTSGRGRAYDLDGYECEVFIDPRRNLSEVMGRGGGGGGTPPSSSVFELEVSVMFETAGGLATKINNGHLLGGERVKEMDFFVASVETPSIIAQPPDPAEAVSDATLTTTVPLALLGRGGGRRGDGVLHVQRELLGRDGALASKVAALAGALRFIVFTCAARLLLIGEGNGTVLPLSRVKFTYFATMRADASVVKLSERDGFVYFNVMVLQQQRCVDVSRTPPGIAGGGGGGVGRGISWGDWRQWLHPPPEAQAAGSRYQSAAVLWPSNTGAAPASVEQLQRRTWRYWLERTAAALGHGPPTGLYNAAVRERFSAFVTMERR